MTPIVRLLCGCTAQCPASRFATIAQFARAIGRSRGAVWAACVEGRLPAARVGRGWLIDTGALGERAAVETAERRAAHGVDR